MFDTKGNKEAKLIENIQDSRTGETIHRVEIDPKLLQEIKDVIKKHQETTQGFVMNAQNYFTILKAQLDLLEKIGLADKSIKETLTSVQKRSKLDPKKPWAFNIQLNCFEYRTAPTVDGGLEVNTNKPKNVSMGVS